MSWIREGELNLLERFSANVLKVRVLLYDHISLFRELLLLLVYYCFITTEDNGMNRTLVCS